MEHCESRLRLLVAARMLDVWYPANVPNLMAKCKKALSSRKEADILDCLAEIERIEAHRHGMSENASQSNIDNKPGRPIVQHFGANHSEVTLDGVVYHVSRTHGEVVEFLSEKPGETRGIGTTFNSRPDRLLKDMPDALMRHIKKGEGNKGYKWQADMSDV